VPWHYSRGESIAKPHNTSIKEVIVLSPGYTLGAEDQDTRPADARQSQEPNPYVFRCGSTGSLLPTGTAITPTKPCASPSLFLLADLTVQIRPVYLHSTFSALEPPPPLHIFPSERVENRGLSYDVLPFDNQNPACHQIVLRRNQLHRGKEGAGALTQEALGLQL